MHAIGVRELKNRLTRYLALVMEGQRVVVTDRGKPVAVFVGADAPLLRAAEAAAFTVVNPEKPGEANA